MVQVEDTASVCYWRVLIDRCPLDCPLLSPGYPGIYPPNTECFYHVLSKNSDEVFQIKASGLSVKPREFNLQKNCQTDYIEIYEGRKKDNNKKIGRFCGQDFPNITTSTNEVAIFFVSGRATPPYNYTGFHLSVIGVTKEWHKDGYQLLNTMCSWRFNATAGSISSPEHWLPEKTTCQYSFHVYPGHYLELIIHIYGLDLTYIDLRYWRQLVPVYAQSKLHAAIISSSVSSYGTVDLFLDPTTR
ncbi:hypothetical protein LSH36_1027g01036 [Paralvinella palmiformis]|uniref:CUB domain-containing protein n=1 Tax=Paralvinella palmiformis TaxID=53620 RepID=A0AAD9IWH5_9ANNE|nr:hypothetical protein LSH36_1027g01036 [Paralvinella palmiformis]